MHFKPLMPAASFLFNAKIAKVSAEDAEGIMHFNTVMPHADYLPPAFYHREDREKASQRARSKNASLRERRGKMHFKTLRAVAAFLFNAKIAKVSAEDAEGIMHFNTVMPHADYLPPAFYHRAHREDITESAE